MDFIDYDVESVNAWEAKQLGEATQVRGSSTAKTLVGVVDQFFSKINVAAVKLNSQLKVGDIIEIGTEEEAVRQRISSMQIDRVDVSEASEGDDVGIKLNYQVPVGSSVYKIG